jgi:hypothetical protein
MTVYGWIARAIGARLAPPPRRRRPRTRAAAPGLESLEPIALMSRAPLAHALAVAAQPAAEVVPFSAQPIAASGTHAMTATQTTAVQTAVVPDTRTNFTQPFAPPLNLFNPNLGQLVAVHITATATLTTQIQAQNLSSTSAGTITGFTNGTFTINGLGAPIPFSLSGTNTMSVPPLGSVTFPVTATNTKPIDITDPAQLAQFVATVGRTTITPTLVANVTSAGAIPNGNLTTSFLTFGSGSVSITYEYLPQCPAVVNLVRFGIHHQPTQLQLTFSGPLNPADATNTANYTIIAPNAHGSFTGPGIRVIPVIGAAYDANNNTVTLTTAVQLNVHHLFQLRITLPCNNNIPIVIEFGGKKSLGGFFLHGQHFTVVNGVPVPG